MPEHGPRVARMANVRVWPRGDNVVSALMLHSNDPGEESIRSGCPEREPIPESEDHQSRDLSAH
jgi:hypothetical protein